RRHARQAAQTVVEVADRRLAEHVLGVHLFHEVDTAPWAVHLLSPQHVCGARGQAEPAVHTVVEELAETLVAVAGDRLGHGGLPARSGVQIPPVPRPGANRWS